MNHQYWQIGFIVNPIAGMGGRVGLKGTDGVFNEAVKLGAKKISPAKAIEFLNEFISKIDDNHSIKWLTCSGDMGFPG